MNYKQIVSIVMLGLIIIGCTDNENGANALEEMSATATEGTLPLPTSVTPPTVANTIEVQTTSLPLPSSTPIPSLTLLPPVPTATESPSVFNNGLTLLFYGIDGHLYRTDSLGIVVEQLSTVADESEEGAYIFYRPPQVSPDGRWLALNGGFGGAALLDIGDGVVVGVGRGRAMLSPTWSSDSQQFAYLGSDNTLCVVAVSDLSRHCPFQNDNQLEEAVWSPDGSLIAVIAVEPVVGDGSCCQGQVLLVDPVEGQFEVVGPFVTGFEFVAGEVLTWLPDGSGLLIKKTPDGRSALYRPGDQTMVSFSEPLLDVSPDGQYLLFSSGAVSDLDGTILYSLPSEALNCGVDRLNLASWAWSFDSQRLAYTLSCQVEDEAATQSLFVLEGMSGSLLWQQTIDAGVLVSAWTTDDSYLLFQVQNSGLLKDASIWRLAADGSASLELVVEQAVLLDVAPQWVKEP